MEFKKEIVTFKTSMADKTKKIIEFYEKHGAFLKGHFEMRGGQHTNVYAESDFVLPHTLDIFKIAFYMAQPFIQEKIEAVAAPSPNGTILQTAIAYWLSTWTNSDVIGIYAEKNKPGYSEIESFHFRKNHKPFLKNKKILLADDILTTKDGTLYKIANITKECEGIIAGAAVMINRGKVTAEDIGIPKLYSVVELPLPTFKNGRYSCPGCNAGLPLNKI